MISEHSQDQDHLIKGDRFRILFQASNKIHYIIEHKRTLNSNDTVIN